MGVIRQGPPKDLMKRLANEYTIRNFVETGTYKGSTTEWASQIFDDVQTIELSDQLYSQVTDEFGHKENINFVKGKSQNELTKITPNIDQSTVFWLDAHYSGEGTAGETYECPLLEEIEAVGSSEQEKYIFIDDARLFCSPPPRPHDPEDWPTISEIVNKINTIEKSYYIIIVEDVIIAVPQHAKKTVQNYAQDAVTGNSETAITEGIRRIQTGARQIIQGLIDAVVSEKMISVLNKVGLYQTASKLYQKIST
ncbi:hypothetical protein [Halorubrum sp. GN11GM_10-3_MGM]|uniref:hypothetical protein n=1 Tax=Halorubrum sp. GN11GM_10-3_MGM TaxID=2518111 RepID=UPI0010F59303|nr:hypothetical protein [Halorubrum sp. GN11GM_10-3_MGM]TKX69195.1 hypothetical protein EXE40_11190 [Halorubrum sp. GN11GM_10-3_MGM]